MPGLFTTLVHRLNDAVEYHAEYAADVQSGHRNKNGFKTDLWHQREREAEERSRRRRHRHRRHHGEGKEGETGEESVMMSGALVEGGAKEAEGEAAAAPEGVVDPFADPGAEKEDSQGKQEHRRRGGEGHGHRRRHRDTNDAGIEILEPSSGPLGRELPPGPPGQGPPIQGPGPQGPPRQRSKWEHKRTGRSMSPQKVEMRPWLRKLLKKGPTAQKGGKGMPQAMNGPPFPMGDPRGQQGRRMTPPGQPYIDGQLHSDFLYVQFSVSCKFWSAQACCTCRMIF